MARLTYPTVTDLRNRLPSAGSGPSAIDSLSTIETNDAERVRIVVATAEQQAIVTHVPGRWDLLIERLDTKGQPQPGAVNLSEPILARLNRLMSPDGVSVQRDWRTKTHVLRAAQRRVLPLTYGVSATAMLTGKGWIATDQPANVAPMVPSVGTPSAAPSVPAPAPSLPALAPTGTQHGSLAEPVRPEPAPRAAAVGGSPVPAAYAGKIVLTRAARAKWHASRAVQRNGDPAIVAMVGPSGAGKTHAVHALSAEEPGQPLDVVKFDCSGVIEPGDWFGTVTLDGNGTRFVPSDLLVALTLPGARTLLLDEMNRANPRALNALLPVLDGSGTVTVPQSGKRERVNRAVQIVVTANIGSQFLATEPLDEAVRTRISTWIEVEHLGESEEQALILDRLNGTDTESSVQADGRKLPTFAPGVLSEYNAANLARLGAAVRASAENGQHPPVSTRQLLAAARLMAVGLDPRLAVDAAILDGYNHEGGGSSERAKVKIHVAGITWREPKPGSVMTGDEQCVCGHGPGLHGIGTEVSPSTHCRTCVRDFPGNAARQCTMYNPTMVAATDESEDTQW